MDISDQISYMGILASKQLTKDKAIFSQAIYPTNFKEQYPIDWPAWTIRKFSELDNDPGVLVNDTYMTYTSTQKDGTLGPKSEVFAH